jgi:hypothetical protein
MEPAVGLEPTNLLITIQLLFQLSYAGSLVARPGIEPGTQGFSVPRSTN